MQIKSYQTLFAISLLALSTSLPVKAAVDHCMVGKWKPDSQQLKKQFEQVSKQVISNTSGQVILHLNKNGSGTYQLNNFMLSMNSAGGAPMKMTLIMNGNSKFNWSAKNKQFTMKNATTAIKTSGSVDIGGMKMPIPSIPISDQQAASGVANGKYLCSGNKLTFQPKTKGSLLTVWHRI